MNLILNFWHPWLFQHYSLMVRDPTNSAIQRNISTSDTEAFSQKIKHLIKFAEKVDGIWKYRFASHPRFAFWAYNMRYRKRLLGQGSYFLKQNPGESNSLQNLKDIVAANNHKAVMKILMRYAKNVLGTNAKQDLKAIISHMGAPTIFWTLSCAEMHWPDFHSLLSIENNSDNDHIRQNIIDNPHLIDWFVTIRTENFVKIWLYEILRASWHWYRFEYAVMRGTIHVHGLAKLKNDPGLCELTQVALKGFIANKEKMRVIYQLNN